MPALKHPPLLLLLCFGLIYGPVQGQEAGISHFVPPPQPNVQERLLAELLARLPEAERASMIAQTLAAIREGEGKRAAGSAVIGERPVVPSAEPLRDSLTVSPQSLRTELEGLRAEVRGLRAQVRHLQSLIPDELARTPLAPSPATPSPAMQGRAFLLPNFQRPGIQSLPGPYVNQPSTPLPNWEPSPSIAPEQATELAQLQRDLQRLNQRLRQWQDPAAPPADPVRDTGEPAPTPQATRPSPLLPR